MQLRYLLKREFLEYKGSCVLTPFVVGAMVVLVHSLFIPGFQLKGWSSNQINFFINDTRAFYNYFLFISIPYYFVLFFTQLNYFSHTLFYDRKDRSALFWFSMPVSEKNSIGAKFLFGLIVLPLFFAIISLLTSLLLFFIVVFRFFPNDLFSLDYYQLINAGQYLFISFLYINFWLFPVFSWAIFCSAYAKRSPLLMTFVVPFLIIFFEIIIKREASYLGKLIETIASNIYTIDFSKLASFDALWIWMIGLFFAFIAYSLRRRCFRFELS